MTARKLLPLLLVVACAAEPEPERSAEELATRAQELIVRGVAHAEIDQWSEAIARFTEATELGAEDPVLAFNLGVAHFRNAELDQARGWLERVPESAPVALRARVEYLRAKLALESGDVAGEAAAYRRAMALDPSEVAYPYSLSQVLPRLGDPEADTEVGALLERAAELWPENVRLLSEVAQWSLARPEPAARRRGLELAAELTAGDPRAEALFDRGREEAAADAERAPVSLRRALGLLRPGKVFQTDSAALDARLALLPLAEPVTAALRRQEPPAFAPTILLRDDLLPPLELEPGETLLAVRSSNDAVDPISSGPREADLTILTDRRLLFLARNASEFQRISEIEGAHEVLVGELDGDGRTEILALGSTGVALYGRAADGAWSRRQLDPELASARARAGALLVDFEHDGDLDLLLIDDRGRLQLATHRGESGLGAPAPSPLDVLAVDAVISSDLDGDADQDLLVAMPDGIRIFVNWRQGEFRPGALLRVEGRVEALLALDYDSDARFDLVAIVDGGLALWLNREGVGLERNSISEGRLAEGLGTPDTRWVDSLTAADLNLDGELDLVLGVRSFTEIEDLVHPGGSPGVSTVGRLDGQPVAADGLVAIDLDGDSAPDPLILGAGLETLRNAGTDRQGFVEIVLRGLKGKVPLDGRGARLDVWFGLERLSRELERPHTIVGLGGRRPALVKVTWPNGISEYIFEPEPDTTHTIVQELRIEGSCPFLYASDGRQMRFVTDILGMAPLGMLAAPDRYVPADPEEYLRLPEWVAWKDSVELRITEELREVAYIDQAELVVVDAPAGVEVYNGERFFEGFVDGLDLRLLGALETPVSVQDAGGRDALDAVAALDHRYLAHSFGDRLYQGAVQPGRLVLEVPHRLAATGRVSLLLTGWLHWGNTSTNVARSQDPSGAPIFPRVEIPSPDGRWRPLEVHHGLPAGKTKPVVVDLSGLLNPEDPRVAVTTDFEVYWDRIAVAETLAIDSTPHRIHRLAPSRAELAYGGFSRWYRPTPNGPYLFDYADRRPYPWRPTATGERAIAWQEHEGFYTPFGPVTGLVRSIDDRLVIFGSGEELALTFDTTALPALPEGWRRALFLHSEGWEKDGDPNVACSQTVGPLPSRNMIEHPCPQTSSATQGATRWVDRHRLERRVLAWSTGSR